MEGVILILLAYEISAILSLLKQFLDDLSITTPVSPSWKPTIAGFPVHSQTV